MLSSAAEEIKKSDDLWKSSNIAALRDQQEYDFGLWGPYAFEMDASKGKWESFTTNRPKMIGNKVMGLLSSSWRNLFINVDDETRAKRKSISLTERAAIGLLDLADRQLTSVPSGKSLQDALSFYAPMRGGVVVSQYLTEDENGKVVNNARAYDSEYCQWIEGVKDLLWFCHRQYVTKYYLEDAFKKQIKEGFSYGDSDTHGRVLLYTFWDKKEWKVGCNGEYLDGDNHNLDRIPVFIRSCGSVPAVQSENYQDVLKYAWQSVFASNRDLPNVESKLLSIELTKALESGRVKGIASYDSNMSGGNVPEEVQKLVAARDSAPERDALVFLDKAKGQEFNGFVEAPDNRIVDQLLTRITGMDVLASIDPVTLDMARSGSSGAAVSEYRAAALEFLNPFKKCIEDTFVWLAEDSIKQYKDGGFGEVEVEGKDNRRLKFNEKIKPGDVEEKRFECSLVPDRLRDEAIELGLAIQKVEKGLSSRKTAMTKHNIVEDPDHEMDLMEQESHALMASRDPVQHNLGMAAFFKDKGDTEMALYHTTLAQGAIKLSVQAIIKELMGGQMADAPPQSGGNGGSPQPVAENPDAMAGRMAAEPMTDMANSMRQGV